MTRTAANEFFTHLKDISYAGKISLSVKYYQMREALKYLCEIFAPNESLQITGLTAQITFLCTSYAINNSDQNRLHTFRIFSNEVLNKKVEPQEQDFLRDLKTLCFLARTLYQQDIPYDLYVLLPKSDKFTPFGRPINEKRIRASFHYAEDEFFHATLLDLGTDNQVKIRYRIKGVNEEFTQTVEELWTNAQINLLDVSIDEEGYYIPSMIILEPDYLIDISSLAECFKDYGAHPNNYLLGRFIPINNSGALLIGNIANLFLDEWIYAENELDYQATMKKAFRNFPLEIASCEDLLDPEKEKKFFADCKIHFLNIGDVVNNHFKDAGYNLDKNTAILEPSYICEALGIQGRLDYMQQETDRFIEMKSGKADEYTVRGKILPKENHKIQMLLYMAVLEYNMGINHRNQHPYLLYTKYQLLYPARTSWTLVKKAINLRNLIIANEYSTQLRYSPEYTWNKLREINPIILNEKKLSGKFWHEYLCPSIEQFTNRIEALSPLERLYFLSFYNFVTKELYLSKSGNISYNSKPGASSLWLSTLAEKCEAGEILYDLQIIKNHAADIHKAYVTFSIPQYTDDFLPNFRIGDIVILYERNSHNDNATNKLIFKGNIETISIEEITVRIRSSQRNKSVLPPDSKYAIEHDQMDSSFRAMYHGFTAFMTANQDRKELILCQREAGFENISYEKIHSASDDFERIALKAHAAKDYFLLVGPPGTGKTSRALRKMVELFYNEPTNQILLLAYTNRAVDEICQAIITIQPQLPFLRVGNELTCDKLYREYLLENALTSCNSRKEVYERIQNCRVFVGTVASIANKPELFKLKTFDVLIVDEASQILEPQLLSILCTKDRDNKNAIGKFILIGDHKQLPAVVLQSREQTTVHDTELNKIGITNLSDSLFERLYRFNSMTNNQAIDMLHKQGRMHPEIAAFPNTFFYGKELHCMDLPHQLESLDDYPHTQSKENNEILRKRILFIPSSRQTGVTAMKTNMQEAKIVAYLASEIYHNYSKTFNTQKTLGIITPYRNQIALIKKELVKLSISELNEISVDTVERYQGSERDVIIYSFCINHIWQLAQLSNTIEENGIKIDRKLNVALTRARKQLFLIGNPELLSHDPIYDKLIKWVQNNNGFTNMNIF